MTTAYPLQWPAGRRRTERARRKLGRFNRKVDNGRYLQTKDISVADAVDRLQGELDRIGARLPVVSSNVELRLDGLPRSGQRAPDDPGVALYFQLDGKPHCMPCDTYVKVEHNIAAIAAHIEATRAIERHGVATVSEMFAGFEALPPPGAAERPWWEVLGVERGAGETVVRAAYREKAKAAHPDAAGGSAAAMAALNAARDAALAERA